MQNEKLREAAQAYVDAVNGEPEKDCWDTEDGMEAPGAEKFASDWSWEAYDDKKQKAFDALRATLASVADPAEAVQPVGGADLQSRVQPWMMACFGPEISADKLERGDRLLEEVFELLQSGDYPRERVRALEDYVWSRPKGEPHQEVGGVTITLAAYCLAHGLDMHEAGETELARIWTKVEKIRAKQAAKPTGSALPISLTQAGGETETAGPTPAPQADVVGCTCHPDDNPPVPCAQRYALSACRAAFHRTNVIVPEGYALVPIEPTREMWAAMADTLYGYKNRHHDKVAGDLYKAMLAAAALATEGSTDDH